MTISPRVLPCCLSFAFVTAAIAADPPDVSSIADQGSAPEQGEVLEAAQLVLVAAQLLGADFARIQRIEREHERLAACRRQAEVRMLDGPVLEPDAGEREVGGVVAEFCPSHSFHFT